MINAVSTTDDGSLAASLAVAVTAAHAAVLRSVKDNDASHDMSHVHRVMRQALRLAREEGVTDATTLAVVELGALLHDLHDYKYSGDDSASESASAVILRDSGVPTDVSLRVLAIIRGVSFSSELDAGLAGGSGASRLPLEVAVVQDADRLDAIGAIGVARCLTFGGAKHRVLYDPAFPPLDVAAMTKEAYRTTPTTTLNHFHEKLLLLRDLMKTKSGRAAADQRHEFMLGFLAQFKAEWEGAL